MAVPREVELANDNKALSPRCGQDGAIDAQREFSAAPAPPTMGYVYFVSDGEDIKIGFSERPVRRLTGLQSGHKKELKLLAVVSAGLVSEKQAQDRFDHLKIRGEWYRAAPELTDYIAELNQTNPLPTSDPKPQRPKRQPVSSPASTLRKHLSALSKKYPGVAVSNRCRSVMLHLKLAEAGTEIEREYHKSYAAHCVEALTQIVKDGGEYVHANHFHIRAPIAPINRGPLPDSVSQSSVL